MNQRAKMGVDLLCNGFSCDEVCRLQQRENIAFESDTGWMSIRVTILRLVSSD
jgi:hypothetical protein